MKKQPISDEKSPECDYPERVNRGDSWDYVAKITRVSHRNSNFALIRFDRLGFRVVRNKGKK